MKNKNILIIGATPYKTNYRSRFLDSYFCNFDKKNLFQFFTTDFEPDSTYYRSCYKLTDKMMLKKLFSKKVDGKILNCSCTDVDCSNNSATETRTINSFLKRIIRKILWRNKRWETPKFKCWINEIKPSAIFLVWHENQHLSKIAYSLSKELNVPLLISINDDYIFLKKRNKQAFNFAKKIFCDTNSHLFYISDLMKQKYDYEFNKRGMVIHATSKNKFQEITPIQEIRKFCYFGSVSLGRMRTIFDFSKKIDIPNNKIDVFTNSNITKQQKNKILRMKNIELHPPVSYKQIEQLLNEYDAVLLVEELFNKNNISKVKYSLSSKVADSLSSGKICVAIGNKNTGLINYFSLSKCGLIINEDNDPNIVLRNISNDYFLSVNKNIEQIYYKEFYSANVSNDFISFVNSLINKS